MSKQEYMRQWRSANKERIRAYEASHAEQARERARRYYWRHRKERIEYAKRFTKAHAAKIKRYRRSQRYKELTKKHNERARERIRDFALRKKYGIGLEQYKEMLQEQNGLCKICKRTDDGKTKWGGKWNGLVVDHCHKSGRVRGLLCHNCNWWIALAGENAEVIRRGSLYLRGKL